jgi:hypothetical protein
MIIHEYEILKLAISLVEKRGDVIYEPFGIRTLHLLAFYWLVFSFMVLGNLPLLVGCSALWRTYVIESQDRRRDIHD